MGPGGHRRLTAPMALATQEGGSPTPRQSVTAVWQGAQAPLRTALSATGWQRAGRLMRRLGGRLRHGDADSDAAAMRHDGVQNGLSAGFPAAREIAVAVQVDHDVVPATLEPEPVEVETRVAAVNAKHFMHRSPGSPSGSPAAEVPIGE